MKEDFSDCRILDMVLIFYTYTDFVDKCQAIKRKYETLNPTQKMFYHYYIYANQHMSLVYKDRINDYLNNDCNEDDLQLIIKSYKPRNMEFIKK